MDNWNTEDNKNTLQISKQELSKASRKMMHSALNAGAKIAKVEIPKSVEWIYGVGFKLGVFLLLKSFLCIRYLSLSMQGYFVAASQIFQGIVFVALGLNMQLSRVTNNPYAIKRVAIGYGFSTLITTIICFCREIFSWELVKATATSNWFMDFFTSIPRVMKEFSLSIVFWDIDIWTFFCFLLCIMTVTFYVLTREKN